MTRIAYNGKKYGARAMTKLVLEMMTWPPLEVIFIFLTCPPNSQVHRAWVSSWPKTYINMGLGRSRKITIQQAAPARSGTQTVSAPCRACSTGHNARAAPAQTGSNRRAMMNLIHFGTGDRIQNSEFRSQKNCDCIIDSVPRALMRSRPQNHLTSPVRAKAAVNRAHSRRLARFTGHPAIAKRLECGFFSAAFERTRAIVPGTVLRGAKNTLNFQLWI